MISSENIIRLDREFVWHPFTQMQEWMASDPVLITGGEGIYLYDASGREYIDSISSVWLNIHGHNNSHINEAIKKQVDTISHSTLLGLVNEPSAILAGRLVDITPDRLVKVFYSDNGSTAVEIALKMAFQYWQLKGSQKTSYLSLKRSYHGDTIGAVSIGGIDLFHSTFEPLLFHSYRAEPPYCYRCHLGKAYPGCALACVDGVEEVMRAHGSEIAAFVIEPKVMAASGMLTMPDGYLGKIEELCRQYDILLVADEVAVGFGRTGRMFAVEHEGVTPDFLCLSKGLTGGYLPLAVTMTTQAVFDAFLGAYDEFKTFFHGHSYTGNQLGCSAAIASLELFETEKTVENSVVEFLKKGLERFNRLEHVGSVRQLGLIAGIELVEDKRCKKEYHHSKRIGSAVCAEALKRGMISRPLMNTIQLMPPLVSTEKQVAEMLDILFESIRVVTEKQC